MSSLNHKKSTTDPALYRWQLGVVLGILIFECSEFFPVLRPRPYDQCGGVEGPPIPNPLTDLVNAGRDAGQ